MAKPRYTTKKLWENFLATVKEVEPLTYQSYYRLMIEWLKRHRKKLGENLMQEYLVDLYMELDPSEYVIDNPDFPLNTEYIYLEQHITSIMTMRRSIVRFISSERLEKLVTIDSGINCPRCIHASLKCYIAKERLTGQEHLVLCCDRCPYAQYADGSKKDNSDVDYIRPYLPANKNDLAHFGYEISSKTGIFQKIEQNDLR